MTRAIRSYDAQNLACAKIILSNVGEYGGEGGLMVRHSRMVLARLGKGKQPERSAVDRRGQMKLEGMEAA